MKPYREINSLKQELNQIDEFYRNFVYIKDVDVNIDDLRRLEYFKSTCLWSPF